MLTHLRPLDIYKCTEVVWQEFPDLNWEEITLYFTYNRKQQEEWQRQGINRFFPRRTNLAKPPTFTCSGKEESR